MTDKYAIWTIGHGSRPLEELLALLEGAGIACLVDVRAYPASRRHPHFARAPLEKSLAQGGVRYVWEGKALGGRRTAVAHSPHIALKDPHFRAYADHMMTAAFREGLARLVTTGRGARTAIMCAERLPSECHRSFISDALVAHGAAVTHIVSAGVTEPHALSAGARRTEDGIVYDVGAQLTLDAELRDT